jgi:SulP family sulfate permease
MVEAVEVNAGHVLDDVADDSRIRTPYYAAKSTDPDVIVYHINGAFFFGATARVLPVLERMGETPRVFVLDFTDVPLIDTTAARALVGFVGKLKRAGTKVYFAAARPKVRRALNQAGLKPPLVCFAASSARVKREHSVELD